MVARLRGVTFMTTGDSACPIPAHDRMAQAAVNDVARWLGFPIVRGRVMATYLDALVRERRAIFKRATR